MIPALPLRWALLLLFPTLSHQTSGYFSVKVQSPVSGFLGSSVSLHCAVANNMDVRHLAVRWYRPKMSDTPVLFYKNTQIQKSPVDVQYQGRVFLLGELEKGDVSLKLENLTVADRGDYVCHVSSDDWYDKATVSLRVRAVGSSPVLSLNEAEGGKMNVSCQSHGWLPEPSITWTDKDGKDLKHLSKFKFTNNSEGFIDVSSWLIVSPSESEWISCSVGFSDQERKEGRIIPHTPTGDAGSLNGYFIAIPILLLLCAAGIAVFCLLRKKGLILSKRKRTENIEGTPSESEPLNKSHVENQDQNDSPSIITIPHAVVGESRGEQRGSSSFSSPVFSTAGSATDKPNITAFISNPTPAATMSEMEPSAISSNPTPAASTSNLTSSIPTPASTPINPTPTTSISDPTISVTISKSIPAGTPLYPTPAGTISNPTPATTMLESTSAATNSNGKPAATMSQLTAATLSSPTTTATISNPTPAATLSNSTPATSTSNHTTAATNSNPIPATSTSNHTSASTNSIPATATTSSHPTTTSTTSEPTPPTTVSNPTPAATTSIPPSAATNSNPTPATSTSNHTSASTNSIPATATTSSHPTTTSTTSEPTPPTTVSNPTPAATTSIPPSAATTSIPPSASTNSNPTPVTSMSETEQTATISESTTVPSTSPLRFSSVNKHPTSKAETRTINTKGRKRKDMGNEKEHCFDKDEVNEIITKRSKMESPANCSDFKSLCKSEAADYEGEMSVDDPTTSVPKDEEMETTDHECTEEDDMQCG
ncbi:mucin-5AC isoform X2 [Pangasianodon hypophthalmus]|uniref:mucin-5AC isoform X2 n=1 Tax=Pangasianodon hypophthalmus TaxID=310915 RepID=UPI002306FE09|nr:mucin-5AC isoform X2 [Pangasianodon hypophthalmus]